jgi:hypothetical protein
MTPRFFLREPLFHFLVLGAALFLYDHWTAAGSRAVPRQIVLTSGQIEHLVAGFTKTWKRSPTDTELKGIIDDWVREELAVRAATEAGLERGDTIIRRRLRQKFEFLVEDVAEAAPPSDRELEAWFAEHADTYRSQPRLRFRQVFFSKERRGATTHADAALALERLVSRNVAGPIDDLGDASQLPENVDLTAVRDISLIFGDGFADQIVRTAPGTWSGPIESTYGLHLVLVSERIESSLPDLAAVRPAVERDYVTARRKQQLDKIYEGLLEKFSVVIEGSAGETLTPKAWK